MNAPDTSRRPPAARRASFPLLAVLLTTSATAAAQAYPNRPIRFIVPFPPGGSGDVVVRAVGQKLTEAWGQAVVVDNRAGASGNIGLQVAARSAPDGYTLVLGTASTHAINPGLQRNLPYDIQKDFAAIAMLISVPNILVAHPSVPARTMKELIELARARPGQLGFASNGIGTSAHMAGELLKKEARIQLVHVPYKGAGIAINDVLGGHVPLLFGAVATSLPHVQSGRLRALGVTSLQRSAAAPDVPTVVEAGLPGFEVVQWFGAFAPSATPADVVSRLHDGISQALQAPEVKERLVRQGFDVPQISREKFGAYVRDELAKWTRVIREAGIKGE
jgi:tripartite-type tricarboxylate transporter receptor subunit TctC